MITHEQEIEQLRGLVFTAAYRLRTLRQLSRTDEMAGRVAEELDAILAELAAHESGRPLESAEAQLRAANIGATGDGAEAFMRQIREAKVPEFMKYEYLIIFDNCSSDVEVCAPIKTYTT